MRSRSFFLPAALLASFPASAEAPRPAAASPVFVPEQFFIGRTEGVGTLKLMMSKPETVKVRSNGHVAADGTLVLDQVVERPSEEPERRQWRFRKLGPGRYTGTLSVANGPVSVALQGNRLHLKYKLKKGNVGVEQWVYLQPGGKTALNHMTLRRMGMKVGTLEDVMRKMD